jgi:hypothetical protein
MITPIIIIILNLYNIIIACSKWFFNQDMKCCWDSGLNPWGLRTYIATVHIHNVRQTQITTKIWQMWVIFSLKNSLCRSKPYILGWNLAKICPWKKHYMRVSIQRFYNPESCFIVCALVITLSFPTAIVYKCITMISLGCSFEATCLWRTNMCALVKPDPVWVRKLLIWTVYGAYY